MEQLKNEINFIEVSDLNKSRVLYEMKLPNIVRNTYIFVILTTVLFLSYVFIAPYNVTITGKTIIKPEIDITYIVPISNGILTNKYFNNGDYVYQNQLLYCLENEHIKTQISNYEHYINENIIELNKINSVINYLENFNLKTFKYEICNQNEILQQISTELNKYAIEYLNSKNLYEQEYKLYPAYTSKNSIDEKKKNFSIAELNLTAFLANTKKEYEELKVEKRRTSEELDTSIKNLQYQLSTTMITSPTEGFIEEIQPVTKGESILSENRLAKIVPKNRSNLRAFIEIDSNDIAELQINMPFYLNFPKYPTSEFLKIHGSIQNIPNDSLFDIYGIPKYQIIGVLDTNYISTRNKKRKIEIVPGMIGTSKITIRKERLIIYLLKKLNFYSDN